MMKPFRVCSLFVVSSLAAFHFQSADAVAGPGELVIPAVDLARPEQRSETPASGKWWLNQHAQDWGARDGTILMTGMPSEAPVKNGLWQVIPASRFVPERVPALVVDPKLSGWYRIYVGLYCDGLDSWSPPLLLGKLSGEPFPEYLQAPRGSQGRVAEAYWKSADLTGKQISIVQPKAPMPHVQAGWLGGITHLRLVPMSAQEVEATRHERELPPPNQRLFAMLDSTDEIFWNGTAENEDDIRAIIYRHHASGFGRVYWRTYGTFLDNSLSVPEAVAQWTAADDEAWMKKQNAAAGWMQYIHLAERFDPLAVAAAYGREIGCDVQGMVRFDNYNRPPYAKFWHEHPECYAQMLASEKDPKTGNRIPTLPYKRVPYSRVLSLAYPEVRTYYVSFFKQIASTGVKGIMIDLLRHPPIAGYEPIVTEAFKKKYGKDMEPLDVYKDPQVQELFSGYLRDFLVELRRAIGNDIEISVRCTGPESFGLRGREWIESGLINTIVDGHWYSGNGPRPTMDATVAAVGTKGKAMAAAESSDVDPNDHWRTIKGHLSPAAIEALAAAYSGRGVASFGLYESTVQTWSPEARRAILTAGWNYQPKKAAINAPIRAQ
jgi:hypothetical protein